MGKILQVLNEDTGKFENFQKYRTAKARSEALEVLEKATTDTYKFEEDDGE